MGGREETESQCIREGFLLTSSDSLMYGHFLALVSVFHRTLTLPQQRQRECLSLAVQTVNEFVSLCQLAPSHPASLAETHCRGIIRLGSDKGPPALIFVPFVSLVQGAGD